jgi:hypothetical protein
MAKQKPTRNAALFATMSVVMGLVSCAKPMDDTVIGASPGTELEAIDRLKGHWSRNGLDCAKGPLVTVADNGDIIVTTPDTRFVHDFDGVGADRLSVHTIVKEPESAKGARYVLTPLFFATATPETSDGSTPRTWQLQVREKGKAGPPNVWDPCEMTNP